MINLPKGSLFARGPYMEEHEKAVPMTRRLDRLHLVRFGYYSVFIPEKRSASVV